MANVNWVDIMKVQEWVQCKKCGHRPHGQPSMACSGCKKVHGEWSPNPWGLYITVCQRRYMWQQALARHQAAEKQLVANQDAHKMNLDKLRPQALKVSSEKNEALAKQRDQALKAATPGPNTKARANAEVAHSLDEIEELSSKAAALNEKKIAAQARLDALQLDVRGLEDSIAAGEIETRALKSEGDRLKEALISASGAPARAAPAAAAVAPAPQMMYAAPQPQPQVIYQQAPQPQYIQAQPQYVQMQAAPAPVYVQAAPQPQVRYVQAAPAAPSPVYMAAPAAPAGQWVIA